MSCAVVLAIVPPRGGRQPGRHEAPAGDRGRRRLAHGGAPGALPRWHSRLAPRRVDGGVARLRRALGSRSCSTQPPDASPRGARRRRRRRDGPPALRRLRGRSALLLALHLGGRVSRTVGIAWVLAQTAALVIAVAVHWSPG